MSNYKKTNTYSEIHSGVIYATKNYSEINLCPKKRYLLHIWASPLVRDLSSANFTTIKNPPIFITLFKGILFEQKKSF